MTTLSGPFLVSRTGDEGYTLLLLRGHGYTYNYIIAS
jgi:hypothetical protein